MTLELDDREYVEFYAALRFTIPHEGGYVNDPDDPGGETKWGISKRYHPKEDIANLTPERAAKIYYDEYWIPSGANELERPMSIACFDTAVLCGVSRAKDWLRRAEGNYAEFCSLRKEFHKERVRNSPRSRKYLVGWLSRVHDLEDLGTTYA